MRRNLIISGCNRYGQSAVFHPAVCDYLIHEVVTDQKSEDIGYQPSMDINQLNVAILLDRLDTYGSENFKIDKDEEFNDEWKVLTESREEYYKKASKVLLKDL